ncbi:PAS domain S-box protein [Paenibacillus sp. P26]|nr:PAS domain S-box protein [Paenibacillus sp. P26]
MLDSYPGKVVYDEHHKPLKVIGTTQDITDRKRAELELQRAKEVFESFIHHHLDSVVLTDAAGIITSVNPKFEDQFGWSGTELVGLHAFKPPSIPEAYREEMKQQVNSVLDGGCIHGIETVRVTKSGVVLQVQISYFCIRDREGNISGGAAIIRDITEQKEAQQCCTARIKWVSSVSSPPASHTKFAIRLQQSKASCS